MRKSLIRRKELGISIREAAQAVAVAHMSIFFFDHSKGGMIIDHLLAYSKLLDMRIDEMIQEATPQDLIRYELLNTLKRNGRKRKRRAKSNVPSEPESITT